MVFRNQRQTSKNVPVFSDGVLYFYNMLPTAYPITTETPEPAIFVGYVHGKQVRFFIEKDPKTGNFEQIVMDELSAQVIERGLQE